MLRPAKRQGTQHDYAKMLLARDMPGDRGRAQDLLSAAAEQYQKLGMTPWLDQTSELLDSEGRNRHGSGSRSGSRKRARA